MQSLPLFLKISLLLNILLLPSLHAKTSSTRCIKQDQRAALRAIRHEHPLLGPIQVKEGDWLSPGDLLAPWLPPGRLPIVLSDANELRFLPHSLPRSSIVLAIDDFPLDERQVDRVIAVAKTLEIKVHALWMMHPDRRPAMLERLVAASGGLSLNLSDLLTLPSCYPTQYQITQNF